MTPFEIVKVTPDTPGLVRGMDDHTYHGRPELSSTGARHLLPEFDGSPARFKYEQGREFTTAAFDLGKAVHAKVLGVGAQAVVYPSDLLDARGAASTNAAREWADAVRAEGNVPMKAKEIAPINGMAEAILAHPTARALLELPGDREVSVFSEVEGVPSRCRFDVLTEHTPQGVFGIDVKTCSGSVRAEAFAREVLRYGYHVQAEWYKDTARAAVGDIQFVFIAVETSAPYLVAVHQLDVIFMDMGRTLGREARRIWTECTRLNRWPGHPDDVQLLTPPIWAQMAFDDAHGNGEIKVA